MLSRFIYIALSRLPPFVDDNDRHHATPPISINAVTIRRPGARSDGVIAADAMQESR